MNLSYPKRLVFLAAIAAFGVVLIVLGLFDLQVVNSDMWEAALEQRSNFQTIVHGARGDILDARGELLARDVAGYDLMIVTAGIEGSLHECRRCGHRMSILPEPGKPMEKRYTRCPRCRSRSGEQPIFKPVDERSTQPLAKLLGWSGAGLQQAVTWHVQRNRRRVENGVAAAGNIGEDRLKERRVYLRRKYGWEQYRVKTDIPYEAVREVTLHPKRNPGFRIRETRVRRNVGGAAFAQLIGRKPDRVARADGMSSGSGLELLCDRLLAGEPGYVDKVRDPKKPGTLKVVRRREPIDGVSVQLTIARRDQEAALAALGRRAGAFVVVNAETGAVLALASAPSYKPENFSTMWRAAQRNADEAKRRKLKLYLREPDPRLNRAVQGWYSPGSTMKPFTALAGLTYGAVRPRDTIECRKLFTLNGKTMSYLRCNGTHGDTDLRKALVKSCNVYFQTVMHSLLSEGAEEHFRSIGHTFGFGRPTGLEVEWKNWITRKTFRTRPLEGRAQYGSLLQHGIGQGYINCTPAQVARAYAGLMTGRLPKLHIVARRGTRKTRPEHTRIGIPPPLLEQVREALRATNDSRTLAGAGLDRYPLALKTGTAQT
ncbi:MAG: penicillin-binding transpeptidase domain-containing protein, partial [Planctomycetota bacterium]